MDFTYDQASWARTLTKFAGLLGSLGFVALAYWLFPELHSPSTVLLYRMQNFQQCPMNGKSKAPETANCGQLELIL